MMEDCYGSLLHLLDSFSSDLKMRQEESSTLNSLKKAFSINTEIQALIDVEIQKIKVAYQRNLERQALIESREEMERSMKDKSELKAMAVFAAPYFQDVRRRVPPENEDIKIKRRNFDVNAYLKPPKPCYAI